MWLFDWKHLDFSNCCCCCCCCCLETFLSIYQVDDKSRVIAVNTAHSVVSFSLMAHGNGGGPLELITRSRPWLSVQCIDSVCHFLLKCLKFGRKAVKEKNDHKYKSNSDFVSLIASPLTLAVFGSKKISGRIQIDYDSVMIFHSHDSGCIHPSGAFNSNSIPPAQSPGFWISMLIGV